MKKLYGSIVNHSKLIFSIFTVLIFLSLLCKNFISVNYDINEYLPEDSASTIALEIMNSEFHNSIPNARVMIKNITVPEALEYKKKLLNVDGVIDVIWLDDVIDITVPLEISSASVIESYYKDNIALFTITISKEARIMAVDEIRKIIGDENAMTGSAVSSAVATTSAVNEINRIAVIAVIFALLVLALTTSSWIHPLIILGSIGVAIIINSGSNIIFGEISFITNAAGSILQLAVSLDYSVFLMHRFEECHKGALNAKEAMVDALCKSTSSILSSGLTTVIGFLALTLMQFKIGPDLGFALAKGIAISLVTVFVFTPVLVLAIYKMIDKTSHKPFLPSFKKFGRFIYHIMIPMVFAFAIVIVPAYLASNSNEFLYGASQIFDERTQLGADTAEIESAFGKSDTYILMVPKGSFATEKQLSRDLWSLSQVTNIISYVDTVGAEIPQRYLSDSDLGNLISQNYSRMILSLDIAYESSETFELVENIRNIANEYYPDAYYLAGEGVSTYDLKNIVTSDMRKVNLVAIGAVFLVLLLTMRSISLPIILVLGIETAIWINLAIPYFEEIPIFYMVYLIISSIQLGATVDYAILFTERYKEYRTSMDKKDAIIETISSVTVSILTSGSALTVVGLLLGYISTHGLLSQLGLFLGKGTLCSLAIVLFVLPGMLYIFDGIIQKTTLQAHFYNKHKE